MSNLPFYPKPLPANTSITTRGNVFWRDGERFFVKGIAYNPRANDVERGGLSTPIDPLCDDHLPELEQDIDFVRDLGMNSISIYYIDSDNNHAKAMKHLGEMGIYVMVPLFTDLRAPKPSVGSSPLYNLDLIIKNFRLVHEMALYPNTIGFVVSDQSINNSTTTKMSEILRACIRDTKAFLQHIHPTRQIPVGISARDIQSYLHPSIQYFSAGTPDSGRADFFANQCYSWAGPSSFQISGWKNMVETIAQTTRIPMLLAEYGTSIGRKRPWDEVSCLYSPDMTGVYSGGFAYTLLEGGNGYGVVEIDRDTGRRRQKGSDYANLKKRFRAVNESAMEKIANGEVKAYEDWIGELPSCDARWPAGGVVPPFPGNWEKVVQQVLDLAPKIDEQLSPCSTMGDVETSVESVTRDLDILSIQSTTNNHKV